MLGSKSSIAPFGIGLSQQADRTVGRMLGEIFHELLTAILPAGMSCPCIFRAIAPTKSQALIGGQTACSPTGGLASLGSSNFIAAVLLTIPELAISNSPKAAVGVWGSLSRSSSHNSAMRRAAALSVSRLPSRSISRSDSSLGQAQHVARRSPSTMPINDERPSTRRPGQSENLALAFKGAKTRSRSRPPIFGATERTSKVQTAGCRAIAR